jgi:hypothetical protein
VAGKTGPFLAVRTGNLGSLGGSGRVGAASEIGYGSGGWFGCHVRAAWDAVAGAYRDRLGKADLVARTPLSPARSKQKRSKRVPEKQGKANKS